MHEISYLIIILMSISIHCFFRFKVRVSKVVNVSFPIHVQLFSFRFCISNAALGEHNSPIPFSSSPSFVETFFTLKHSSNYILEIEKCSFLSKYL